MELTFGEKIRNARKLKKLTQKQLAEKIGAKHNSVSDWENNKNKPDPDTIELLCGVLGLTPNYLLVSPSEDFSPAEKSLVQKYRSLDSYGQETVDIILDREFARTTALRKKDSLIKKLGSSGKDSETKVRFIQYYQRLASAGSGQIVFDNLPTEQIAIPDIPKYRKVSYAIGVNGRSMEPMYHNGETLLVEKTDEIEVGEIGIFMVDGESFVKKLGENELISVNNDCGNIPLREGCRCMGRVIDRYMSERERSAMEVGLHALQNALSGNEMIG